MKNVKDGEEHEKQAAKKTSNKNTKKAKTVGEKNQVKTAKEEKQGKAEIEHTNKNKKFSDDQRSNFYDGSVSFTHFISLELGLSLRSLQLLWDRCAAGVFKRNETGNDLVIPVRLVDGQISCILIQVKNYGQDTNPSDSIYDTFKKMLPPRGLEDIPYYRVLWRFISEPEKKNLKRKPGSGKPEVFYGLNTDELRIEKIYSLDLFNKFKDKYQNLLNTRPGIYFRSDENTQAVIRSMCPVKYDKENLPVNDKQNLEVIDMN